MTKSLLYAAAIAAGSLYASSAPASEWGCQVLLCVSGNWQATPSCHPAMYRLLAAMKRPGFSWPTCPAASSSAARKDVYGDCPEGWTVGYSDVGHDGNRSKPNMCEKRENLCFNHRNGRPIFKPVTNRRDGDSCQKTISMPRPVRSKPWYVEYTDAKGFRQRAWFNLNI